MRMRDLTVGDVPVRALRVTFVGELGWELYCPTEYGAGLWRTLWEAGREHGLIAGGYRAIDSLRLEKGYRVWGADITPDETPYEAGLGFCVKPGERLHRLRRARATPAAQQPAERPAAALPGARRPALGRARQRARPHRRRVVGRVTSGGYGYTVERSIAYAYLPATSRRRAGRGRHLRRVGRRARSRASRCSTRRASACEARRDDRLRHAPAAGFCSPCCGST